MIVRFCSNFHNSITTRQCVFGGKLGLKGQYCKSYATLKFQRTLTDKKRMSTGDVTHEFRTNRMVTDSDRTSNGRLCPFYPMESFEHVQNFPPDGTDITGQGTDSPD